MDKQRFYIDTKGNDDEAYREAMQFAGELANADADVKRIVLLIASKGNAGWFERLYGHAVVQKLHEGVHFKEYRVPYKFETVRNYRDTYAPSEIIIACGLTEEEMEKADDSYSAKAIILIPWLRSNVENWLKTWKPTELRGKQESVVAHPEPSCIAKKAMEDLTESINMATGLTHPMDERMAKTFVLALHKYDPLLDASVVGAYLIGELGWHVRHAREMEKLISTLKAGKFFKGGDRTGLQYHYKRWTKECEDEKN